MVSDFESYEVVSFDCYGTLIDWESGIWTALMPWAERHGLTRDPLIADFGRLETGIQQENPTAAYPTVLARVLHTIADERRIPVATSEARAFGRSVGDWPSFADTAAALNTLKERFRLVILSNVDLESFSRSNTRLGVEFDLVLTSEEIGTYKPALRNFEVLMARVEDLGVPTSRLLHVAESLYHDHGPATSLGLSSVWIDRRQGRVGAGATPQPGAEVSPDWTFPSMAAFAKACR